jgi:hypothetical protein
MTSMKASLFASLLPSLLLLWSLTSLSSSGVCAFSPKDGRLVSATRLYERQGNGGGVGGPIAAIGDFFAHFDDVMDDFMNKRMGNGELFYGKRKFKPSGRPGTEGKYDGMGMSDKARIDMKRQYRDEIRERAMRRRMEDL